MAIRTFVTLEEADALESAMLRHNTRLRYIVRDAVYAWVFDPTTGRDRLNQIEKVPCEPHCEISALIPNWYYGILKWKCIGAGFQMREAFREAMLSWLALAAEGGGISPITEGNAAWMQRQQVSRENYLTAMSEVTDAQKARIHLMGFHKRHEAKAIDPKNDDYEAGHRS